ncbi:MAG: hypothetical protein ACRDID_00495, partial [Ktedonobacterales bacterium]
MSGTGPAERKSSGVVRVLRASVLTLSVFAVLAAIGFGAAVTAQRYTSAHHVAVGAPTVSLAPQVITLVEPNALSQRAPRP